MYWIDYTIYVIKLVNYRLNSFISVIMKMKFVIFLCLLL